MFWGRTLKEISGWQSLCAITTMSGTGILFVQLDMTFPPIMQSKIGRRVAG